MQIPSDLQLNSEHELNGLVNNLTEITMGYVSTDIGQSNDLETVILIETFYDDVAIDMYITREQALKIQDFLSKYPESV